MPDASAIEVKEQVREASDISDVVGSYIALKRQGRNFVGRCLWHDDTRPSLQVNTERQSWKCWVCGIGGDVFSFVMKAENLDFREALTLLAERAGIQVQAGPRAATGGPGDRGTLLRAVAWAEQQYHRYLREAAAAQVARSYLDDRGITVESIKRFRVGFAPDEWTWLLDRARDTEFSPAVLERVGLVRPRESGGYYDYFRGRVMFPIADLRGRPIAFGGRILPQLARDGVGKYFNSPETPLFSKSNQLYALDKARDAARHAGTLAVMEGYTDVVMAHQHGVEYAAAVLGTALTERHIEILKRLTDSVTLVLDGDEAGRRRTDEVLGLFIARQVDLKILTLPQDLDPCDFIRAQGGDAFDALLGNAVDAIEHKIRTVTEGMVSLSDTHQANTALEAILDTIAQIPRPAGEMASAVLIREQQILSRLARQFMVPEQQLRTRLTSLRRDRGSAAGRRQAVTIDAGDDSPDLWRLLDPWDREFFELLLAEPQCWEAATNCISAEDLRSEPGRACFQQCAALSTAGTRLSVEQLMLHCEDPPMRQLWMRLDEESRSKRHSDPDQRLSDLLAAIEGRRSDARVRQKLQQIQRRDLNFEQQKEQLGNLLKELTDRDQGLPPTEG